ncbi:MAG TPA: DUF1800 domain-containing protein [Planctomycetes bacterium]|nr:DUF1800 domain-containing protein [Planctomycetota bacterium]
MTHAPKHPLLRPYRPGTDGPFGPEQAAKLLRRFTFGAPPERLLDVASQGLPRTLGAIFERPPAGDPRWKAYRRLLTHGDRAARRGDLEGMQSGWVVRMMMSPFPLAERLSLFWHDHFATAASKVTDLPAMQRQNRLFLDAGLGKFPALLGAVARDAAMLIWLDGVTSSKAHPNENFARELFELFSLGIGHYTEDDVKECARAFTGWRLKKGRFHFDPSQHDDGEKTVLGVTGPLKGEDVLEILARHPRCARFIAVKLWTAFVGPIEDETLGRELGRLFDAVKRDIRSFLRRIASSRGFFLAEPLVAGPVEFAIGAIRGLGARASGSRVVHHLKRMGQEPFNPPSVAGWPTGLGWITSATAVARENFAGEIAQGTDGHLNLRRRETPVDLSALALAMTGHAVRDPARLETNADIFRAAGRFVGQPQQWIL